MKLEVKGVEELEDDPKRLRALLQAMADTKSSDGARVAVEVNRDSRTLLSLVVTAPFAMRERELAEALVPVFKEELERLFNEIVNDVRAAKEQSP